MSTSSPFLHDLSSGLALSGSSRQLRKHRRVRGAAQSEVLEEVSQSSSRCDLEVHKQSFLSLFFDVCRAKVKISHPCSATVVTSPSCGSPPVSYSCVVLASLALCVRWWRIRA